MDRRVAGRVAEATPLLILGGVAYAGGLVLLGTLLVTTVRRGVEWRFDPAVAAYVLVRTFTEKLLSYSIGRTIEPYDLPAVRAIARNAAVNNYRWSSVISAVVKSAPFTMATVSEPSSEGTTASTHR